MKALTLWQPWATLLARGAKKIETRSWACRAPLPCVLAVHAGKALKAEVAFDLHHRAGGWALMRDALAGLGVAAYDDLPRGAVLGLVRVVACLGTADLLRGRGGPGTVTAAEAAFGDYSAGRWGWCCDLACPLPRPVPAAGRLGLWEWEPPAEVAALAARMRGEG